MPTTMTPQVRFRSVDGVRIRYADSGGSDKPVAVLTHRQLAMTGASQVALP